MNQSPQKTQTSTPTNTISNKNPLSLHSFEDRGKAIAEKVDRIKSNPNYQKLPEKDQKRVLSGVYHKYVAPAYAGAGYGIPQHDTWVGGAHEISKVGGIKISDTFKQGTAQNFAQDVAVGASKALDQIGMFGVKMNRKAYMAMHGLENHFASPLMAKLGLQVSTKPYDLEKRNEQNGQKFAQNIQSADYFLESHPRRGFINRLGSDAGEFLVQLPMYEAIGAGRGIVGVAGKAVFDGLPLTQKLASSPVGKFVAKRIGEATDGFLSGLVLSGGKKDEAVSGAAGFAAMGAMGAGAGKVLKIASAPLIKKWTANTIAMGGIPLATEMADSVMNKEVAHDVVAAHKGFEPLDLHSGISIHPETEEKGKFIFNDPVDGKAKEFAYSNKADRQQVFNNLQHIAGEVRSKYDPVLYKIEEGEQAALNSLSLGKFNAPFSRLTSAQRVEIGKLRYDTIEQAANEAPVHLPELTKMEHQDSIESQMKAEPMFANNAQMLAKLGIKLADVTSANEIEKVSVDTGIKSAVASQAKIGKSRNEAISSLEKKRLEKGISINAIDFNKHLSDTMAYFRAPKNRVKLDASIGPKATTNFNQFYEVLKEADGNKIHFENPYHRMLFHYGNRKNLPDGIKERVLYEISKISPGKAAKDVANEADWFHVHLLQMARSGRLVKEGNIFNSSRAGGMQIWTPWQKQLTTEVDKEQYNLLKRQLKRYPEVIKSVEAFMQEQSKIRLNAATADEWMQADRKLHDTLIKTTAMLKTKTIY